MLDNGVETYGVSVKIPPTIGPNTDDTPNAIPKNEMKIGLLCNGMSPTMIMIEPEPMPDHCQSPFNTNTLE
jgi:hypothetical protein